jgi:hypothetical protein
MEGRTLMRIPIIRASVGALVTAVVMVSPVAADRPDGPPVLTGETLVGTGTVTAQGDCREDAPVTFHFHVSGPATGAYTGTHWKDLTMRTQFAPGSLDDGTLARLAPRLGFGDPTIVREWSARFRIVSPTGMVTGTESGGGTFGGWWAVCDTTTGEVTFHPQGSTAAIFGSYQATIHSKGGSYQTQGGVRVNIAGTVGPDGEGEATITQTFTTGTLPDRRTGKPN